MEVVSDNMRSLVQRNMKIVTIKMDLVIDSNLTDLYEIAIYLTEKLYSDPEFFGDFGQENIVEVKDFE